MTKELRNKLLGILDELDYMASENVEDVLAQIDQAYHDAGYTTVQEVATEVIRIHKYANLPKVKIVGGYMTSQEWYKRFIKALPPEDSDIVETETHGRNHPDQWTVKYSDIEKAARKISELRL